MSAIVGKNYELPALDLNFAENKSLIDSVTGRNLITFSRSQSGKEATYVGSDGLIKYAGADEPRFDYDPETGESLGLLIEESRTNSLPYSNTLTGNGATGDGWGKNTSTGLPTTEVTLQPNAEIAPDGTFTASKLIQAPTAGLQRWWYFNSAPRATGWTGSIFAKAAESDRIVLNVGFGGAFVQAIFDLSNVTATYNGNGTYTSNTTQTITPYPNGWYKCSISTTVDFGFNVYYQLYFIDENNNTSFQGDGVSGIYVWGAQLEQATFPTSYIPTSGSTVTRPADNASITGTNFSSWYKPNETTLYIESPDFPNYSRLANGAFVYISDTNVVPISLNDGIKFGTGSPTTTNRVFVTEAGVNYAGSTSIGAQASKFAIAVATNDFNFISDGTSKGTSTSVVVPTGMDRLVISSYGPGYAHISRLTYWPKRLPDLELQQLTK